MSLPNIPYSYPSFGAYGGYAGMGGAAVPMCRCPAGLCRCQDRDQVNFNAVTHNAIQAVANQASGLATKILSNPNMQKNVVHNRILLDKIKTLVLLAQSAYIKGDGNALQQVLSDVRQAYHLLQTEYGSTTTVSRIQATPYKTLISIAVAVGVGILVYKNLNKPTKYIQTPRQTHFLSLA